MIGYILLGTNDLPRACAFYDAFMAEMDAKRSFQSERMVMWASSKPGKASLGIVKPHDGAPATAGNGTMVSLGVSSQEKVQALHRKALELGAKDEGAPGLRTGAFYGAYFRDLDGNKFCVFTMLRA